MKKFDITFRGEVLPKHDPEQVKAGFVELFSIQDPGMLEDIFSGETVVLRSNLDRKAAAEYFVKVNEIGGVIELVTSRARYRDNDHGLDLPANGADMAAEPGTDEELQPGNAEKIIIKRSKQNDKNWPVSNARRDKQADRLAEQHARAATVPDDQIAEQEQLDVEAITDSSAIKKVQESATARPAQIEKATSSGSAAVAETPDHDQESRRRLPKSAANDSALAEKMRRAAEQDRRNEALAARIEEITQQELESLRARALEIQQHTDTRLQDLERQCIAAGAAAENEIANLKEQALDIADGAQEEHQRLQKLQVSARNTIARDSERLEELELQSKRNFEETIARLQDREQEVNEETKDEITTLEDAIRETRRKAAEEISRLEQLLTDTKQQAETEIRQLEELVESAHGKAEQETAELTEQRLAAEQSAADEADDLQQQFKLSASTAQDRIAEIQNMQLEASQAMDEELARLEALEREADTNAEQTIAGLKQAMDATRDCAVAELEQLQAAESEVMCKQAAQLARLKRR